MARTDLIKIIPKLGIFSFIVHIFGTLINTRVVGEGRFCSSRGDYCPFARFFYARSFKIFNYSILAFYHCSTSSFNVVKVKKLNYKFIRERENVRLTVLRDVRARLERTPDTRRNGRVGRPSQRTVLPGPGSVRSEDVQPFERGRTRRPARGRVAANGT